MNTAERSERLAHNPSVADRIEKNPILSTLTSFINGAGVFQRRKWAPGRPHFSLTKCFNGAPTTELQRENESA